ncbi:mRNA 3'-end-processing protein rna14 [Arthroderma uncinatum]|uniref:mRNA 3'-end-processing protein rna14 n=1 Tax=Arthroderma uncinatum TaxID=74035 RepID=UPI00144AD641|nr:mRNA 3'-end-processing protein rna14 [Arthroderma uncinatum]KAF3483810.1 mRNA 3'-end-processing protein rna14 [Arthroderma uncinatum]
MAEEGAEYGVLQSQALNADAEAAGDSDSDDYDPSETIQEQFSANIAASNHNTIPHMSPFVSSSTPTPAPGPNLPEKLPQDAHSNDSAFLLPPSGGESKASTAISQIGVFEEGSTGEEDGGDAEYEPPAAALSAQVQNSISTSADMSQRSVSENINEPVSQFHVQQQNIASDQNTPHVSINFPASDSHVDHSVHNDGTLKPTQGESKLPGRSAAQSANSSLPSTPPVAATSRTRLPHDRLGILEDRIQADPRGDTDAWLELISEHRSRNKLDSARQVYERVFKVFPSAAEQWVEYATMESENNELYKLEQIFTKCLLSIPNVQLWSFGDARRTISSAYDLALQHIGIDKDSGNIWVDYIQFLRSGPGNIGGSGWQDQQKMDLLRKAYQRAICIPTQAVNTLWKEYDQFEMGLNKLTGRKFIQDKSPSYMTARSSYTELQNITRDLVRLSLPRLPPAPGYEGDYSFSKQVEIWKRWIQWEKDDPLVLKEEDPASYKQRTLYVYKQSLMALRFVPEMFFDTADFCFQNGMETEGNDFLKQGIEANPESCLLAFKRADRLELSSASEQDPKKRGARVREPYDKLLDALYELIGQVRAQEATDLARVEEQAAQGDQELPVLHENDDDEDETDNPRTHESAKAKEIESVKKEYAGKIGVLSKAVSFVWIALMRAMRRIQGKGKPGEIAGSRQIFADARKRGRITSDVYIASALLEYHCYKDPAATKIFERGAKLFPEDEVFALEYLKHLIDINDITNARAVFETTVRRLTSNPENVAKAKPIFAFLHEYESRYGDLVQINNLESRMRELFPEDPTLKQFAHRFSAPSFDPTTFQPVLSPSQLKPRTMISLEEPSSRHSSPAIRHPTTTTHSPKRSFPLDEYGDEPSRPRKFIRAESPLKGAAGRRDQQKRLQSNGSSGGPAPSRVKQQQPPQQPSAGPLPRDVVYLLSIIPPASTYDATRFSPEMMVNLLRQVELPSSVSQLRLPPQQTGGAHQRHQYGGYRPNA